MLKTTTMSKQLLLFFGLFVAFNALTAQNITVSEEISMRSDQSYTIVGKYQEKTLLFYDKGTVFEVQAFNNDGLGASWTKELELDKKRPEVLEVFNLDEHFYVLYKFK